MQLWINSFIKKGYKLLIVQYLILFYYRFLCHWNIYWIFFVTFSEKKITTCAPILTRLRIALNNFSSSLFDSQYFIPSTKTSQLISGVNINQARLVCLQLKKARIKKSIKPSRHLCMLSAHFVPFFPLYNGIYNFFQNTQPFN